MASFKKALAAGLLRGVEGGAKGYQKFQSDELDRETDLRQKLALEALKKSGFEREFEYVKGLGPDQYERAAEWKSMGGVSIGPGGQLRKIARPSNARPPKPSEKERVGRVLAHKEWYEQGQAGQEPQRPSESDVQVYKAWKANKGPTYQ